MIMCVTMIDTRPQQRRGHRPPHRLRQPAIQLTARGGVLGLFVVSFLAIMLANWTGWTAVAELAFVAACAAAASYTKRGALLAIVVSPPAIFLAACLCAESLTARGTLSALTGIFVTLGISAPWLFAGTVLVLVVALFRGLPAEIAAGLRGAIRL
jgi:hypothetical protein